MPPDDILERAPEGPSPEPETPALAIAWAPFPVEFGGTWWLDAADGDAVEPEARLVFAWAPFPVEFGASFWADPECPAEREEELPAPAHRRTPRLGLAGSLGVHLLPLLLLIGDTGAPPEAVGAIPVRLVIEQPEVASVTETTAQPKPPLPAAPPPTHAFVPAPPRLKPTPPEKPAPHRPTAAPEPKPIPPAPNPPLKAVAVAAPAPQPPLARPAPAAATAASPAPAAETAPEPAAETAPEPAAAPTAKTAEDSGSYLDYLVTLTRRHADMLPSSFLAGRRGETILSVVVHDDGSIGRIAVKHGSGYPDIDQRIAEMVAAVGRFPPPPQRYRRADLDLDFKLVFPYAVQQ